MSILKVNSLWARYGAGLARSMEAQDVGKIRSV